MVQQDVGTEKALTFRWQFTCKVRILLAGGVLTVDNSLRLYLRL